MKALDEAEFTIVGTGLMGVSLALALRGKVKCLRGVDTNPANQYHARAYFDEISADLEASISCADVVVLATPIRVILHLINTLGPSLKPGTLLIDLGSTKRQIVAAMDTLPGHVLAIGGHPMCGKETSGPQYADAALYNGCTFILCPTQRSTPEALDFAGAMLRAIGAQQLTLPPDRHDIAVAAISHLPYLVSVGLVDTVSRVAEQDPIPWKLAASGFRDTSRLAASDLTMMGDILLTNRDAVLDALKIYQTQILALEAAVQSSDEAALRGILSDARQARINWPSKFG